MKNALFGIEKKHSNYTDSVLLKLNSNKIVNKFKENKIITNNSLETAINNKSLSINSFIRDENNSLHNSIERVILPSNNLTSSAHKNLTDSANKKILVLDYKQTSNPTIKNPNINTLPNNKNKNKSKIVNSQFLNNIVLKENSRNVLNNNFINKIIKYDSDQLKLSGLERHTIKHPFSKYSESSRFLIFRNKILENNQSYIKMSTVYFI